MEELEPRHLMVGVPLPWDIYTKGNRLILRKGNMILNDKQRDQLLKLGLYVRSVATPEDYTAPKPVNEPFNPFRRLDQVYASLDAMLARPASFRHEFGKRIRSLAVVVDETVQKAPDACIGSIFLLPFTNYSSAHSLHVSLLLAILMQRLGLTLPERISLLSAALTMNSGMYEVQNQLYHQALPLSDNQRMEIDHHPEESVRILQDCFVGDELWLRVVLEHHENWEGSGYPYKMTKEEIHPLSHLLYLADVVGAKLTPRRYRDPVRPNVALSQVFMNRGKSIDMQYAALLVKELGIYPPGSYVRIRNGDVALVTHRGANASTPRVMSIASGQGMPYAMPIPRDTRSAEFGIETSLPAADSIKITNLSKIWGYVLA